MGPLLRRRGLILCSGMRAAWREGAPLRPLLGGLAALVADYRKTCMAVHDAELAFYRRLPVDRLICNAVGGLAPNGKRHHHQHRLSGQVLADAVAGVLARRREVETARSFEALLQIVWECAPRGYGELTVYDAAVRLGAGLGLEPTRVHLHSGTLAGARRLLGSQLGKRRVLELADLPAELRNLPPGHIENFLCIYKDRLPAAE